MSQTTKKSNDNQHNATVNSLISIIRNHNQGLINTHHQRITTNNAVVQLATDAHNDALESQHKFIISISRSIQTLTEQTNSLRKILEMVRNLNSVLDQLSPQILQKTKSTKQVLDTQRVLAQKQIMQIEELHQLKQLMLESNAIRDEIQKEMINELIQKFKAITASNKTKKETECDDYDGNDENMVDSAPTTQEFDDEKENMKTSSNDESKQKMNLDNDLERDLSLTSRTGNIFEAKGVTTSGKSGIVAMFNFHLEFFLLNHVYQWFLM